MKVLKFGGTSVGSADALMNVRKIVESAEETEVVVVSAAGGVTDRLILAAKQAAARDSGYRETFSQIVKRHFDLVGEVFGIYTPEGVAKTTAVMTAMNSLLVCLEKELDDINNEGSFTDRQLCSVVSYGERLSSILISEFLDGARLHDSLKIIKTSPVNGKDVPAAAETAALVKKEFGDMTSGSVAIMQGFISSDIESGEVTNLGRGGSDYTASIVAAALDARILEIWTDVDGFMTADPRTDKNAAVIERLSFSKAMDLCNKGAKVIYAPTFLPLCTKNIPILVKNTFNPEAPGSIITK